MKKKTALLSAIIIAVSVIFSGCTANFELGNAQVKIKVVDETAVVTEIPNKSDIFEIVIPDEYDGVPVTEINDFAGCNLENVRKITIGKNVEKIGVWAFANNQKLEEFAVDPENENFTAKDGVLFTKDMKELIFYPSAGNTEYYVPDGTVKIRSKSFYKCENLKSLTLPDTVEYIEEKAFFKCSSLQEINLPISLKSIEMDAFGYCTEIKELTVPAHVTEIGDYAFYNCTSLMKITMQCKKENVTFGKKWQPTNNGIEIKEANIIWE